MPEIKWTEQQEEAWGKCLRLWKRLSELPDEDSSRYAFQPTTSFKNSILRELGLESCRCGCPFCDKFYNTPTCPLGTCIVYSHQSCFETPYSAWDEMIISTGWHRQALAKDFYDYLLKLYEKGRKEII